MMLMTQELMTTTEVATWCRVDASTVRRWVESGRIAPAIVTPGGHYRFRQADVERVLAGGTAA